MAGHRWGPESGRETPQLVLGNVGPGRGCLEALGHSEGLHAALVFIRITFALDCGGSAWLWMLRSQWMLVQWAAVAASFSGALKTRSR